MLKWLSLFLCTRLSVASHEARCQLTCLNDRWVCFTAAIQYDEQEDDSFDANAFFKSIGQGVQGESSSAAEGSVAPIGADINNDLHLSESDNDDDFVPVDDDQSQSNFDMNEFFKPN